MLHYGKKQMVDLGYQTFCFHTHLRRSLEHSAHFELRLRAGDSDDCFPGHWNFPACHLGCGAGGLRLCCIWLPRENDHGFVRKKEGTPGFQSIDYPLIMHWLIDYQCQYINQLIDDQISLSGLQFRGYTGMPRFQTHANHMLPWGTTQEQWIWSWGAPLGAIPVDSYSRWIVGYPNSPINLVVFGST